ncbi:hypothetical protein [Nocardioides sp. SYSU D00038]|uniref:hypothetical protein n=1 Tax=Nocardioides sp. SYSU D00038 TaxID=2812554 RepID=UPI00196722F2|nr:hypothetical protein [Nocardioides sp. SYSU D00038]
MTWWRRNRVWLALLPVVLLALGAAASYRVADYWWNVEPHEVIARGEPGRALTFTDDYEDALGETSRTLTVEVVDVAELDAVPVRRLDDPVPLSDDARVVRVTMDWEADPDQGLRGCTVALRDSRGRTHRLSSAGLRFASCLPSEGGGPLVPSAVDDAAGRSVPDGEERLPAWRTRPVFVVPQDAEITEVLLWWQLPEHVVLPVPPRAGS